MRLKIRGLIGLGLLMSWGLSFLSGLVLSLAPEGQRVGRAILLFGFSKHAWSEFHTWVSFLAMGITFLHITVDWRILRGSFKTIIKGGFGDP